MKKWHTLLEHKNMSDAITTVVCELLSRAYDDKQTAEKLLKEVLANDKIYDEIQNSICGIICILAENDFV